MTEQRTAPALVIPRGRHAMLPPAMRKRRRARSGLRHDRGPACDAAPASARRRTPTISARRAALRSLPRSPRKYLGNAATSVENVPEGTIYTCPMHPEIRQVGPGSCPICGMALEPVLATADAGPNAELIDMTRRFWIGLVLALPVVALEMGGHLTGLHHYLIEPIRVELDSDGPGDAGRALGRLAVLRARLAIAAHAQPQHVHADRDGHRRRLDLQRRRHARAADLSRGVPHQRRRGRGLFRSRRRDHRAGPARPGARTARARDDQRRHPRASRSRAEDRAAHRRRRQRRGSAARSGSCRRPAARAAGREGAGRRRRRRRPQRRRRIDGDRRVDAGDQGGRRKRHRRHDEPVRRAGHRGAKGRPRHDAVADRATGRRSAAEPRADSAAGRPGVRLVRAGRDRGRAARLCRLGDLGPGAALLLRPGRRGRGADHRLPLRARPRDADVDHGRRRPRRAVRRADQERRSARAHGKGRHAGGRQDRHADGGQAGGHGDRSRGRLFRRRRCCGLRQASSGPASIRWRWRSCAPRRQRGIATASVADFDSPTGKGALGKVDGKRIALGNAKFLAELGSRRRCACGARRRSCGRKARRRSSWRSTAASPACSRSPIR